MTAAFQKTGDFAMKTLPIVWWRLVNAEGETCDRCDATYRELQRAVARLTEALLPLGIEPTFETRAIGPDEFEADPRESNRVWIAGRPMEEWLGAEVGGSPCCDVCGESECRTVSLGGVTFEAIPEEIVIRAALLAASASFALGPSDAGEF